MTTPTGRLTMRNLSRYWKALIAAIPAVVYVGGEIVQAIDNGAADGTLTRTDVGNIVMAALAALLVYAKANTPPKGEASDPDVSETAGVERPYTETNPEFGYSAVELLVVVILVILAVFLVIELAQRI